MTGAMDRGGKAKEGGVQRRCSSLIGVALALEQFL